jgi:hypothetical protein
MNQPRPLTSGLAAAAFVLSLAAALWLALRTWAVPIHAAASVSPPAIGPAASLTYAPTADAVANPTMEFDEPSWQP